MRLAPDAWRDELRTIVREGDKIVLVSSDATQRKEAVGGTIYLRGPGATLGRDTGNVFPGVVVEYTVTVTHP